MLRHSTYDFPFELVSDYNHELTEDEVALLATASLDINIVTDAQAIVGVFGCVPLGFLSDDALTWILLPEKVKLSREAIRGARDLFAKWAVNAPWTLYAEVWNENCKGHSLAKFMGFVPVEYDDDLIRYQYKGH